jgi:hypothetical protein
MDKNNAVVYRSHYGTTKQYAEWIAEELGADLIERRKANAAVLSGYDCVVYGGGLYGPGGVSGADLVAKHPFKNLVVFTVGLADPQITDYAPILDRNFPDGSHKPLRVFHLREGVAYKKLKLAHRSMMAMMKKSIDGTPAGERDGSDEMFLRTYGGAIDFTDVETIEPLVSYVRGILHLESKG